MKKQTPQKKICRSYATCPDHTCDSCNSNPYNSICGPTTLDGAGNPIQNNPIACVNWKSCRAHPHCDYCKESSGFNERHPELIKAVTPEVLPPETNALTHSRTNELATTSHSPGEVVAQYRLAVAGTLEMLRFGAMLVEVDSDLNRGAPKGFIKTGDTMQAWLEDYCPSVNYKTAMRFKRLAEGLKREFKIPAKMRLTDALPTSDGSAPHVSTMFGKDNDRAIEIREEIWEFVNGKSARQLMFDFGQSERKTQGGSREGSGRPTVKNVTAQTRAGAAWAKIGHEIDLAQAWKFTRFLPIGIAREALDTVTLLRDSLKERLEEAKTGGSHVK